ncbi:MAG: glycosyltransferase [Solirubrobacterales bacterium]
MSGRPPEVTVVIPTLEREGRLRAALEALAAQTLARERFEVIVVRGSERPPGPPASAPAGLAVRFLAAPAAGAAVQRNVGWRAGDGAVVAFTDDDCRPAPEWLDRLLTAGAAGTIVQGRTEPDPAELGDLRGYARTMRVTGLDPWAPTCNIAYPRELLERVGGFDERFPGAWGEDTDLALRALDAGASRAYEPGALVHHAVHRRSLLRALREAAGRSNIHLVIARHPRQRRELYLGLFASRTHASLLAAAAGVWLLRRRRLLRFAGAAPYLYAYFDRGAGWTPARAARWALISVPRRVPVDAAELAAMAISSARFRVLVL